MKDTNIIKTQMQLWSQFINTFLFWHILRTIIGQVNYFLWDLFSISKKQKNTMLFEFKENKIWINNKENYGVKFEVLLMSYSIKKTYFEKAVSYSVVSH